MAAAGVPTSPLAVVFDMDGTLTEQGAIDFARIRTRIGCPKDSGILEHVSSTECDKERARLEAIVEDEEKLALAAVEVRPDALEVLTALKANGIRTGLITRNCDAAMRAVLERLPHTFDVALSRSFEPVKPDPAPLLHILCEVGADPARSVMVGDSIDDMDCGIAAGTATVVIGEDDDATFIKARPRATAAVRTLSELLPMLGVARTECI